MLMDDLQRILNISLWLNIHGIQGTGQKMNAGISMNVDHLHQLIQKDHAFKFLKHVRGSPAYLQETFYNLLAMIRQLDIPTWFLTLSAADMKRPDVIQCIAYQYGQTLTEDQVKNITF